MRVLLKTKEKRVAFHIVDGVTNQVYSRLDREKLLSATAQKLPEAR